MLSQKYNHVQIHILYMKMAKMQVLAQAELSINAIYFVPCSEIFQFLAQTSVIVIVICIEWFELNMLSCAKTHIIKHTQFILGLCKSLAQQIFKTDKPVIISCKSKYLKYVLTKLIL